MENMHGQRGEPVERRRTRRVMFSTAQSEQEIRAWGARGCLYKKAVQDRNIKY